MVSLLAVGTQAPEFTTTDQDGKTHTLSDFKGKRCLDFYPKDTPRCTKEAVPSAITSPSFATDVEILAGSMI